MHNTLLINLEKHYSLEKSEIEDLIDHKMLTVITRGAPPPKKLIFNTPQHFYDFPAEFEHDGKILGLGRLFFEEVFNQYWDHFLSESISLAQRQVLKFEYQWDLKVFEDTNRAFIEEQANAAEGNLLGVKWLQQRYTSVTGDFKHFIRTFIRKNTEHAISTHLHFEGEPLGEEFEDAEKIYSYYIFIKYLTWRSRNLDFSFYQESESMSDLILTIIKPDLITAQGLDSEDFEEKIPNRLTRRAINILRYFAEKRPHFLSESNVAEIKHQYIGILTSHQPRSFANEAARALRIGSKRDDKLILANLIEKLSDNALTEGFRKVSAPVVEAIEKELRKIV